ncbi:hypothetical protein CQA53_05675 [Helicobacter didelphidarum]|uniref:MobA/VirD2-like nuclease domain-containing protein n=1 Tax=Helicobacter didelphidarum TaxID=2040648 RepID=A0A3D8IKK5_9HELI|nr:relaxase/mobilization nuclease domain-containing protein [Helicobacter didelphidarum]RDU65782.1 hypothetical protein CQA53_05675 [Helicobacter didelphidarum]
MSSVFKAPNVKKLESFLFDFEKIKHTFYKEIKEYKNPPANLSLLQKHRSYPFIAKQAIVKLLSNLSVNGFKNALRYIIQNAEEHAAINHYGEQQKASEIFKDWNDDFTGKKNAKEVWHVCFSIKEIPSTKNLLALEKSVKNLLQKNFYAYKYCYVLHTHQNNPHIHVLINKNNMFSHKKLHFKEKNEIKDFFTTLRNDFTQGLNYYGLHYYNASTYEKRNLLEENLHSFQYKDSNQLNLVTKLEKSIARISKKIENFSKKLEQRNTALDTLFMQRKEVLEKYFSFAPQRTKNEALPEFQTLQERKRFYAKRNKERQQRNLARISAYKEFQEINKEIRKTKKQNYFYNNEIKKLHNVAKSLESQMNFMREQYIKNQQECYADVREKQSYLDFMQHSKKSLSTDDIMTLNAIQRELRKKSKHILENIKDFIQLDKKILDSIISSQNTHNTHEDSLYSPHNTNKDSLLSSQNIKRDSLSSFHDTNKEHVNPHFALQKLLGTKLSANSLIHAKKNIDYLYNILKNADRYTMIKNKEMTQESYEFYDKLLKENSFTISQILNEKIKSLKSILQDTYKHEKEKKEIHKQNTYTQQRHEQNRYDNTQQQDISQIAKYDTKTLRYFQKEFQALLTYTQSKENMQYDMEYLNDFENRIKKANLQNLLTLVSQALQEKYVKLQEKSKAIKEKEKLERKKMRQLEKNKLQEARIQRDRMNKGKIISEQQRDRDRKERINQVEMNKEGLESKQRDSYLQSDRLQQNTDNTIEYNNAQQSSKKRETHNNQGLSR